MVFLSKVHNSLRERAHLKYIDLGEQFWRLHDDVNLSSTWFRLGELGSV